MHSHIMVYADENPNLYTTQGLQALLAQFYDSNMLTPGHIHLLQAYIGVQPHCHTATQLL